MKLLTLCVAMASQFCAFATLAICQQTKTQSERLHLTRPFPERGAGRVEVTATSIQRDLSSKESESIIKLKGNVEVRMVTCGPTGHSGHDDEFVCGKGSMLLHADEVDYNEKTGAIDARGNVHIAPYQYPSSKKVASK
jgi:lipopolysaccharide assembly outer membrane protein LptD (OstA)